MELAFPLFGYDLDNDERACRLAEEARQASGLQAALDDAP